MLSALTDAHRAYARDPLEQQRWTDPQRAFLSESSRLALLLMFNQGGKSTCLAADTVYALRGSHPFRPVHPPPVEWLCISYSVAQMRPLIGKIWNFLGEHEKPEGLSYSEGAGLKGTKYPHITLAGGPGKGSVCYFATYKQGTEAIAGLTLHGVTCDEPMSEIVYGELIPRLSKHMGTMRIGQTVTPESPPQAWLKEKVDSGLVACSQVPFSLDTVIPRGGLIERPWWSDDEAESNFRAYLGDELGLRRDALWTVPSSSRWILNFDDVQEFDLPQGGQWVVGIDHGEAAGKQAGVLVYVWGHETMSPRVIFVDESISSGKTTGPEDAAALMAMLARNGLEYHDVHHWVGDQPTGRTEDERTKSNATVRRFLAAQAGVRLERMRPIHLPRKGAHSVRGGARTINDLLGRRDSAGLATSGVRPACGALADAFRYFDGTPRTRHLKDVFDAGRYATTWLVDLSPRDNVVRFGRAPW